MCGGVDLNHTALTDLQQRLTKVEGSVGKVEQDVGKVQANTFNIAKNKPIKYFVGHVKPKEKKTVLDVSGSGLLHYVECRPANSHAGATLTIELDGKKLEFVHDYGSDGCMSLLTTEAFYRYAETDILGLGLITEETVNSGFESKEVMPIAYIPRLAREELFTKPYVRLHGAITGGNPYKAVGREKAYRFEKSMRITVDFSTATTTSGNGENTKCLYTLDE